MIVEEDGPYDIFVKIRARMSGWRFVNLDCFYCTSVWISLVISFFTAQLFINIFVISALSIFMEVLRRRIE